MKKIGLIVAVEIESVLNRYGQPIKRQKIDAFDVLIYQVTDNAQLYVVSCGVGEIAAASATQFCISKLKCKMIVNFGIVGGLTDEMSATKTCIVEKVVHYDFDTSDIDTGYVQGQYNDYPDPFIPVTKKLLDKALKLEPTLQKVVLASGDKFVGTTEKKRGLHKQFGAHICDMEGAAVALVCNRNKIPFLMIKCVSDGVLDSTEFNHYFHKSASICFELTDKIIKNISK